MQSEGWSCPPRALPETATFLDFFPLASVQLCFQESSWVHALHILLVQRSHLRICFWESWPRSPTLAHLSVGCIWVQNCWSREYTRAQFSEEFAQINPPTSGAWACQLMSNLCQNLRKVFLFPPFLILFNGPFSYWFLDVLLYIYIFLIWVLS